LQSGTVNMTRSFPIRTSRIGPARWLWVRIHPDLETLRAAAHRLRPGEDFAACYGCVHPVAGPPPVNGFAGVVRFALTHLTGDIVAHELVHAALAVYRLNVSADVRLGAGCRRRE
jgi:hypothetical protein